MLKTFLFLKMKHPGGRPPNKTSKTWVDCKPQCFICSLNFNKITELNIVLENKIQKKDFKYIVVGFLFKKSFKKRVGHYTLKFQPS